MNEFLKVASDTAREAGAILRREFDRPQKDFLQGRSRHRHGIGSPLRRDHRRKNQRAFSRSRDYRRGGRRRVRGRGRREILLARRSARRHHQLRARLSLLRRVDRPQRGWRADCRRGLQSRQRRVLHRRARRGRLSEWAAHPRLVGRQAGDEPRRDWLSHAPAQAQRQYELLLGIHAAFARCAARWLRCARSLLGGLRPLRCLLGVSPEFVGHGRRRAARPRSGRPRHGHRRGTIPPRRPVAARIERPNPRRNEGSLRASRARL